MLPESQDGIAFPVSQGEPLVDLRGSLIDGALSLQSTAAVIGPIAFALLLPGGPEKTPQITTHELVLSDMPIDGFVADVDNVVIFSVFSDLLGTPQFGQLGLDEMQVGDR